MDGMNETCPECEAELAPGARFCPRCGGFTGITVPRPVPGVQPTVTQPAMTRAPSRWPGGQPTMTHQPVTYSPPQWPGGQGGTVMASPPGGARVPRAALPAAPSATPPPMEPPADATRADWSAAALTRPSGYPPFQPPQQPQQPQPFQAFQQAPPQPPQSFQPPQSYQQPPSPTRAEPARYQAPPPPGEPSPLYPQNGYAPTEYTPAGYPQGAYPQDEFAPAGYTPGGYPQDRPQDGFAPAGYTPAGYLEDRYPPDRHPQDGYGPTEYAPRKADGLRSFEPSPDYQGPPEGAQEPPRQPPRRHDRDRDRRRMPVALWIVLVVLLAGGAGAAFKLLHHSPSNAGTASTGASGSASGTRAAPSGGTASRGTPSGTASAATEQQAAAGVAALLSQSAADRTSTNAAANDIASCGPNLQTDSAVFGKAVTSRQALLTKLDAVPGRAALPAAVVTNLTGALQASIAADQAYAKWASDELAKTCVPNDTADPGFQATVTPNQQATTDKTQFAAAWQPVAAKYGLTQYQPGQL